MAARGSLETRFYRYVPDGVSSDDCWEWRGCVNSEGYGHIIDRNQKVLKAHRVSYEIHRGQIPQGILVRHACDNPPCVNPAHLVLGTDADNGADKGNRRRAIIIPDGIVLEIRSAEGTCQKIADEYGVSTAYVSRVKNGKVRQYLIGGLK